LENYVTNFNTQSITLNTLLIALHKINFIPFN